MMMRVCLLLLIVGVYAISGSESSTPDELFGELDSYFPDNFPSRFPEESQFFTGKILAYLFFNMFAKYFGEEEPIKFWSKFNRKDFHRVAIDAAFYEYLSKFVDKKMKRLIFNPLEVSASSPEEIAVHRIGDYLDNLSVADKSETGSQATKINNCKHRAAMVPTSGIPGKDFPNHCDIPTTSFTCANKLVPGIYADMETRCQVFHVCWPHRMDTFLCPTGTTFNQALMTCDYWYDSDCSSAPLFDQSLFVKSMNPLNTESTTVMDDESRTTSESPSSTPESDIPEYDGTCQSLINKPLQLNMKFMPVKCEVANLKPIMPETTSESSKSDEKRIDLLIDYIRSGHFGEMFASIVKADELGNMIRAAADLSELKIVKAEKLHSAVVATESQLKNTTGEQIHPSTTVLPSVTQDKIQKMEFKLVEKPVYKAASREEVKGPSVIKSTLLKPSKPSEEVVKRVFDTIITTLEFGSKILNEGVLPLIEKIILDSRRKKSDS